MHRRGFTLVEILVATVILGIVAGMTMTVFQYQNRNWKTESDRAEVAMSAKGVIDEISRMIRMTGGGLPDSGTAGLKVWGGGEERVSFVLNSSNWADTTKLNGTKYDPSTGRLWIAVHSAARFNPNGYVHVGLNVPSAADKPNAQGSRKLSVVDDPTSLTFPVIERVGGCTQDSIVIHVRDHWKTLGTWPEAIWIDGIKRVYNLDSVSFRKSNDTLYTKWNRNDESIFALGVDTLRLQYWHPATGWGDSLSSTAPANRIDKVRIRLVMRTREVDRKLLSSNPATRGYRFTVLETEVALRNENLNNK